MSGGFIATLTKSLFFFIAKLQDARKILNNRPHEAIHNSYEGLIPLWCVLIAIQVCYSIELSECYCPVSSANQITQTNTH